MCECVWHVCVSRMCVHASENVCILLIHSVTYVHIIDLFSQFFLSHIFYIIFQLHCILYLYSIGTLRRDSGSLPSQRGRNKQTSGAYTAHMACSVYYHYNTWRFENILCYMC